MWLIGSKHKVETTSSGIDIRDVAGDVPQFKREYKVPVGRGVIMTVTARTLFGRSYLGELQQGGGFGRWVLFEPERPADKILDREILPEVQAKCEEILRLDREYAKSDPREFVDEHGRRWARQE